MTWYSERLFRKSIAHKTNRDDNFCHPYIDNINRKFNAGQFEAAVLNRNIAQNQTTPTSFARHFTLEFRLRGKYPRQRRNDLTQKRRNHNHRW